MKADVLEYAFADKIVPSSCGKWDHVTKAEFAVLCSMQGLQTVLNNMDTLCKMPESSVRVGCGSNHLHLVRQLYKESTEQFTEAKKMFVLYDKQFFLVRAYKYVGEDYFKIEVTQGVRQNQESIPLESTIVTSLYLLNKIVGDAMPYLLPHYKHNKDFTPASEMLSRY